MSELRSTAEGHVDAASRAADRNDWELAELEYRAALAIAERFEPRDPEVEATLLNNLSRCNEKLGRFGLAIEQARLSILKSTTMDVRERDEHEGRINRMTLLQSQPAKPIEPPVAAAKPPATAKSPQRSPAFLGAAALTAIGGAFLVTGIGCAAALPSALEGLQGPLTLTEIDRLTSRARVLEGLAIGFGTAGILATVGGVVWLTRSHSR